MGTESGPKKPLYSLIINTLTCILPRKSEELPLFTWCPKFVFAFFFVGKFLGD